MDELIRRRESAMDRAEAAILRAQSNGEDERFHQELDAEAKELAEVFRGMAEAGYPALEQGRTLHYQANVRCNLIKRRGQDEMRQVKTLYHQARSLFDGSEELEAAKVDFRLGTLAALIEDPDLETLRESESRLTQAAPVLKKHGSPLAANLERQLDLVRQAVRLKSVMATMEEDGSAAMRPGFRRKPPLIETMFQLLKSRIDQDKADGKISADIAEIFHDVVTQFSVLVDQAEGDMPDMIRAVQEMMAAFERLNGMVEERSHELDLPPVGSRAWALIQHGRGIRNFLLREMIFPMKSDSEREQVFQFLLRHGEIDRKILQAGGDDAKAGLLDRMSLRPFAEEVRIFSARQHAMPAYPAWSGARHSSRINSLYFSGTDTYQDMVRDCCGRLGIRWLEPNAFESMAEARQRALQEAGTAVFDISGQDGPARASVAYEFGIARALGKPIVLIASGGVIPFDFDVEPVKPDPDPRAAILAAIDAASYWVMPRPVASVQKETIEWTAARYASSRETDGLVDQNLKELERRIDDPDPLVVAATLRSLAKVAPEPVPMIIHPPWRPFYPQPGSPRLFHVMPFGLAWSDQARDAAEETCRAHGFEYHRGDRAERRDIILSIWEEICKADRVLVDLTDFNPNAALELGIAHVLGRKTAVMASKASLEKIGGHFPMVERHRIISYSIPGDKDFTAALAAFLRERP